MDVAQHLEETAVLQCTTEQTRVLEVILGNRAVALESQVHEIEILRDDWMRRAGEVERERILDGAEVVQLEDEVLREELGGTPDDPTDTDVRKTELVTGGIDRHNARDLEVPEVVRGREWRDETSRRAINVDWDGVSRTGLVLVEQVRDLIYGLIVPSIGTYDSGLEVTDSYTAQILTAKNDIDADGVLVNVVHGLLWVEAIVALFRNRNEAALNLEVTRKLLEGDLRVRTHDDVGTGLVDRLACLLALLLPDALHG